MSEKRKQALQNLGGKCVKCGSKDKLHLHHIKYAKDSVRWNDKSDDVKRVKEALEHPERFELLCVTCHGNYHYDLGPKRKRVDLITCKICNWVYFPNEIRKHEKSCDGSSPIVDDFYRSNKLLQK